MTLRRPPRPALVWAPALALVATATLVACGGDDPGPTDPASRRGVDARSYYEDYEEQSGGDGATSYAVTPQPTAEDGSAPGARRAAGAPGSPAVPPVPAAPAPDEGNTFVAVDPAGFVATADDSRSTFGLDVDTGSLGVARELLSDGYPVPPASVRVEEWVNGLTGPEPAPRDADLALSTSSAPSTTAEGVQLVRVGVQARTVDPADRPRVNVTLVVDRSGSMDIRERLGLVQSSLALLADRLRDDDTVSVVTFEDRARPVLPPTPVRDTDAILDAVAALRPGGSTNLAAGLRLGYEQARQAYDADAVNLVVLCSDGVANVGDTGPGSISRTIAEEGADGIHLVTVGYGMGSYNDHLMEQLADLGDGFYSYVDTYGEAETLFGTELTTTLVPVAEEARAQVSFDPAAVASYRLVGYENRALADDDFTDLSVDAGELGSGHHATALYEVRLTGAAAPGDPIGTASLRWRSADDDRPARASVPLTAAAADAPADDALALASTTADLAELVAGRPAARGHDLRLADLRARAQALVERGTPGADALVELVAQVGDVGLAAGDDAGDGAGDGAEDGQGPIR